MISAARPSLVVSLLIGILALIANPARAQYTDWQAITDHGGPQAFTARRAQLAKTLARPRTAAAPVSFSSSRATKSPKPPTTAKTTTSTISPACRIPAPSCSSTSKPAPPSCSNPHKLRAPPRSTVRIFSPLPAADRAPFGYSRILPVTDLDLVLSTIRCKVQSRLRSLDPPRLPRQSRRRSPRSRPRPRLEIRASVSPAASRRSRPRQGLARSLPHGQYP